MTEEEWVAGTDPLKMLEFLRGKATIRKLRLFGVACCRSLWDLLPFEMWTLVEATEHYSDGRLPAGELYALSVLVPRPETSQADALAYEAARCCSDLGYNTSRGFDEWGAIACAAYYAIGAAEGTDGMAAVPRARQVQTAFVRDIIGNPFRPLYINPNWITPTVANLAKDAYENRALPSGELDPACLSVLANALENEGCDNTDLLGHLRSSGPHVRGCFAVDFLLANK